MNLILFYHSITFTPLNFLLKHCISGESLLEKGQLTSVNRTEGNDIPPLKSINCKKKETFKEKF